MSEGEKEGPARQRENAPLVLYPEGPGQGGMRGLALVGSCINYMDNSLGKVKKAHHRTRRRRRAECGPDVALAGDRCPPPRGESQRGKLTLRPANRDNSNWSCGRSVKICKKCKKFGSFSLPPREEALFSTGDLCTMRRTERRASPPGFLWRQQRDDQLTFPPKSQFSVCPKIKK
jgi:hypothetical protein